MNNDLSERIRKIYACLENINKDIINSMMRRSEIYKNKGNKKLSDIYLQMYKSCSKYRPDNNRYNINQKYYWKKRNEIKMIVEKYAS